MTPRIYVASLTDYNHAIHHGKWIDADQSADQIHEEVQAMLKTSPTAKKYDVPAEEWAIHDYEEFAGIKLSEWDSFERVSTIAKLLEKHPAPVVAYFVDENYDLNDIPDLIEDRLRGEFDESTELKAVAAYELQFLESRQDIPEDIREHLYVIAEDIARSGLNGGEYFTVEQKIPGNWKFYVLTSC